MSAVPVPTPTRPSSVIVHQDHTPGEVDIRSAEQLRVWLPILGPTCVVLLQELAATDGVRRDIADLAALIGVKPAKVWQALDRLARFHAAWFPATDVLVLHRYLREPRDRRHLAPVGVLGEVDGTQPERSAS